MTQWKKVKIGDVCKIVKSATGSTSETSIPAGSVKLANDGSSPKSSLVLPKELSELTKKALELIRQNPDATNDELGRMLGISSRSVRTNIAILKDKGLIQRIGSKTKGYWEIVKK